MRSLRRRLTAWNRENPGPRTGEYAIILAVIALIGFLALAVAGGQTSMIHSTVSGGV
jgi:hypothetical protein